MTIEKITQLIDGKIIEGEKFKERKIEQIFASDLMSDVLTIETNKSLMLITGLANIQTIRTCEMSDIKSIVFVRGKKVTDEMRELAEENEMILVETDYSLYRASGILYNKNIPPVY